MKTFIGGGSFHQMRYVFIFFIILLQACASASIGRIEGSDFKENLPGLWKGSWRTSGNQGNQHIKITKVEGIEVHLTGLMKGGGLNPDTDEVYGRIENSTLLLTWPAGYDSGCKDKYTMRRGVSNKLMLSGNKICGTYILTVSLVKIE